jgi:hypothetical protein
MESISGWGVKKGGRMEKVKELVKLEGFQEGGRSERG